MCLCFRFFSVKRWAFHILTSMCTYDGLQAYACLSSSPQCMHIKYTTWRFQHTCLRPSIIWVAIEIYTDLIAEQKYRYLKLQDFSFDIVTSQIYFAFLFNKRYNVKEFHQMKQLASENTMY